MIDRFGLLPEPVKNLFRITELKLQATPIGIRKIEAGPRGGRIVFGPEPRIDVSKLIGLIQKQHQTYKLDGQDKLRFNREMKDAETRAREVAGVLAAVAA
jgi:transcription-repair coupling factor (superfamily II helicase)